MNIIDYIIIFNYNIDTEARYKKIFQRIITKKAPILFFDYQKIAKEIIMEIK